MTATRRPDQAVQFRPLSLGPAQSTRLFNAMATPTAFRGTRPATGKREVPNPESGDIHVEPPLAFDRRRAHAGISHVRRRSAAVSLVWCRSAIWRRPRLPDRWAASRHGSISVLGASSNCRSRSSGRSIWLCKPIWAWPSSFLLPTFGSRSALWSYSGSDRGGAWASAALIAARIGRQRARLETTDQSAVLGRCCTSASEP